MRSIYLQLTDYLRKVNWKLLLFVVAMLYVKLWMKGAALLLFVIIYRKEFFRKENYRRSFTWFYFSMVIIALINLLLHLPSVNHQYLFTVSAGIGFWMACIAAAFIIRYFVQAGTRGSMDHTLTVFFILNAFVTLTQLALIMIDAGSLNPFRYQGMHQKYFIGTGDLLTGISFDVSTTNAIICAAGVIYFLHREQFRLLLLCMGVMLLTGSNISNLLLFAVLLILFVFRSSRNQKSAVVACALLLAVFMGRISPQNNRYLDEAWKKIAGIKKEKKAAAITRPRLTEMPDSLLNPEERKQKTAMLFLDSTNRLLAENERVEKKVLPATGIAVVDGVPEKPAIPKDNIHSEPFQRRRDTTALQKELLDYAVKAIPHFDTGHIKSVPYKWPGKIIAMQQTIAYLKNHPGKILTGTGTGNFSSKLAFRATGLRIAGGYPARFIYVNEDFRQNHLGLYLTYFSRDIELHSLVNSPNSVYDQLLSEYGLAGLAAFFVFYAGFFLKNSRTRTYSLPLFGLLLGAFAIEYWFEQLSVVILFEWLLLTDMKKNGHG